MIVLPIYTRESGMYQIKYMDNVHWPKASKWHQYPCSYWDLEWDKTMSIITRVTKE